MENNVQAVRMDNGSNANDKNEKIAVRSGSSASFGWSGLPGIMAGSPAFPSCAESKELAHLHCSSPLITG